MMHDAHAARTLLSTLLGTPGSDGKPRLNNALDADDLAESIQTAINTLNDMADGAGTYFTTADLPPGAFATEEDAQAWLDRNARYLADNLAQEGNESLLTFLQMDGIAWPEEDEGEDEGEDDMVEAQGPEGNGHDLPTCRACGHPGTDDHEECENCNEESTA